MSSLDRRTFLKVVAAIPLALWLEGDALAQTKKPLVRYDVLSTNGQAMLKIYAQGVALMKALPENDPRSWTFQWYIHAVPNDRTKADELSRIYPTPGPQRALADAVWQTCEPHFNADNEPFFLPWHRMYLLRFERIIRQLTNKPRFTLPYWNYSGKPLSKPDALPAAFRTSGPLFVKNRNPGINAGQPIGGEPRRLAQEALSECGYNPQGALPGFCQRLDFGLHGTVHVRVGDGQNMGSVPWAAKDPIFWLHHCNIDRLWASWNKGGGLNPNDAAFRDKTFTFADEKGQQVVGTAGEVLSLVGTGPRNTFRYSYDFLDDVPPCPGSRSLDAVTKAVEKTMSILAAAAPVPLSSEAVSVQLKMPELPADAAPEPTFDMRIRQLPSNTRAYLIISKLQAAAQPSIVYDVYFSLPEGAKTKLPAKHRVGTINFFNAVVVDDKHPQERANDKRFFSFDVTTLARRLQSEGQLKAEPSVTIVPAGEPASNANPVIGSIELVFQ